MQTVLYIHSFGEQVLCHQRDRLAGDAVFRSSAKKQVPIAPRADLDEVIQRLFQYPGPSQPERRECSREARRRLDATESIEEEEKRSGCAPAARLGDGRGIEAASRALGAGAGDGYVSHGDPETEVAFWDGDRLVAATIRKGGIHLSVHAKDGGAREGLAAVVGRLEGLVRREPEKQGVWVAFASKADYRAELRTRFVACPSLEEIQGNYTEEVWSAVGALASDPAPWELGKLVIWSGPTGTGKTYALRALMRAVQERFDFVCVTDPERFAENPAYYMDIVTQGGGDMDYGDDPAPPEASVFAPDRPKLIVLEDAADLILTESREKHFDKVGKLLNMTDGLFAQGRKDLFIVTFNEEVTDIDPAFLRPGRCRASIKFPKLPRPQSAAWLAAHGLDPRTEEETTVADLYRRLHEHRRSTEASPGPVNLQSEISNLKSPPPGANGRMGFVRV